MPRPSPHERFIQLIETATDVFIRSGGYRRTKMTDIARAMNVASGTLFQYVESKEALFDLLLRHADDPGEIELPERLPVPTPDPADTLEFVRSSVAQARSIPTLDRALENPGDDPAGEFTAIVGELFDVLARHRCGIKLADGSAHDLPELAAVWFAGARLNAVDRLRRYLELRINDGSLHPIADVPMAARMTLELCVYWAIHQHWDLQPVPLSDAQLRERVIDFCVGNLIRFKDQKGQ
jgi:AcrR family transcriptional regulator